MAEGNCAAPTQRLAGVRLVRHGALKGEPETVVVAEWILRGGRAVLTKGDGTMGADIIERHGFVLSGSSLLTANAIAADLGIAPVAEGTYLPEHGLPFLLGLMEEHALDQNVWAEAIMAA